MDYSIKSSQDWYSVASRIPTRCNEFLALQSVFSEFSTGLQPAFAFRYPAQQEQGPKESMKTSISKIFDIEDRRSSTSQTLRYRSTKLRYQYMNFSFDIEVIFDIGLLQYRSLLVYRSIFNIEVLRYRSLNTSISKVCEIRDFNTFDIEVQYRALYRSQNKVLQYRSLGLRYR